MVNSYNICDSIRSRCQDFHNRRNESKSSQRPHTMSFTSPHDELGRQLLFAVSICTLIVSIGPYLHDQYLFIVFFFFFLTVVVVESIVDHPPRQPPIPRYLVHDDVSKSRKSRRAVEKARSKSTGALDSKDCDEGLGGLKKRMMKAMKLNSASFSGTLSCVDEQRAVFAAQPCTTGPKYKECPQTVIVHAHEIPPYIYSQNGNLTGILKTVTENLIQECCGCVRFNYQEIFDNSYQMESRIGEDNSSLTLPVYGQILTRRINNYPYVPIVESPGIVYVTKEPKVGKASALLLQSVTDCWPILILIFMMAGVFGIITWASDSYFNPEQFPSPFYKGSWDGFWWALVSMTTVGYGDKAPVGIPGRVIAFVWILIGLVLYSVFSGYVSTESTSAALGKDTDLRGTNVVTFNQSQEQRFAMKSNANVTTVTTIKQFMETINQEEVAGGLLDSYLAGFHEKQLRAAKFIVGTVFDYQFTYGFLLSNNLSNAKIKKCIVKALSLQEKFIISLIQNSTNAIPELTESELNELSTRMFDEKSPIFQEAVTIIGVLLCIMISCGILWEIFYNRPRLKKLKELEENEKVEQVGKRVSQHTLCEYESLDELIRGQNRELELLMIAEINAFIFAFNRREVDFQQLLRDPSFQEMLPTLMLNKDIRFVQYT